MNRKQEIMNVALRLFSEYGYTMTGVQRICNEAEVTKPTLYHYFGSKEGLLRSIYEEHFHLLLRDLDSLTTENQDVMKVIEKMTAVYVKHSLRSKQFFWLSNHLRKVPQRNDAREIVQPFYQEEKARIVAVLATLSAFHTNLEGHEQFLANVYLYMMTGYIEEHIQEGDFGEDHRNEVYQLTKQFLYGIFSL